MAFFGGGGTGGFIPPGGGGSGGPVVTGRFEFEQAAAATTWTVQHMLGQRFVSVQILDDSGATLVADIDYQNDNRCVLTFVRPRAGSAVIRM